MSLARALSLAALLLVARLWTVRACWWWLAYRSTTAVQNVVRARM